MRTTLHLGTDLLVVCNVSEQNWIAFFSSSVYSLILRTATIGTDSLVSWNKSLNTVCISMLRCNVYAYLSIHTHTHTLKPSTIDISIRSNSGIVEPVSIPKHPSRKRVKNVEAREWHAVEIDSAAHPIVLWIAQLARSKSQK